MLKSTDLNHIPVESNPALPALVAATAQPASDNAFCDLHRLGRHINLLFDESVPVRQSYSTELSAYAPLLRRYSDLIRKALVREDDQLTLGNLIFIVQQCGVDDGRFGAALSWVLGDPREQVREDLVEALGKMQVLPETLLLPLYITSETGDRTDLKQRMRELACRINKPRVHELDDAQREYVGLQSFGEMPLDDLLLAVGFDTISRLRIDASEEISRRSTNKERSLRADFVPTLLFILHRLTDEEAQVKFNLLYAVQECASWCTAELQAFHERPGESNEMLKLLGAGWHSSTNQGAGRKDLEILFAGLAMGEPSVTSYSLSCLSQVVDKMDRDSIIRAITSAARLLLDDNQSQSVREGAFSLVRHCVPRDARALNVLTATITGEAGVMTKIAACQAIALAAPHLDPKQSKESVRALVYAATDADFYLRQSAFECLTYFPRYLEHARPMLCSRPIETHPGVLYEFVCALDRMCTAAESSSEKKACLEFLNELKTQYEGSSRAAHRDFTKQLEMLIQRSRRGPAELWLRRHVQDCLHALMRRI